MTPRQRIAAFALVLAGALGAGLVVGSAVGPIEITDHPIGHDDGSHR